MGYPEICPSLECTQPLDPSKELTFTLIESLLEECILPSSVPQKEISSFSTATKTAPSATLSRSLNDNTNVLFPYQLFHLGGDEVDYTCWEKSNAIQDWEVSQGITNGSEGTYEYFVDKVATMTRALNR